ncbi:MAG TPA: FHA domain-containing protein, partial [Thermoanaerobaculia bacterium]|nr:FHA domain-containing protein [Thermoanaerobaculia bacterium]
GNILLRKKKISREQRDRIDSLMQSDGGQFGQLALQEGVLTDALLRDFLKVQVSEIVYDIFVWNSGAFAFAQDGSLPSHAVTISIDVANLIMEGARRIEQWEQCVKLLPDKSVVFRVVATPRDEKITLSVDEWKILFLINGQRTLEDLCNDSEDEAFDVYRVVYGLAANHLIEPIEVRDPDDTGKELVTTAMPAVTADATIRQSSPRFGQESTMRDQAADDDTSLLVSEDARLSYSEVAQPLIAQLRGGDGIVIPLTEPEYLVGRHRDNQIQIPDLGVSGFHARIYRGPDGFVIEDLKSRNGTWINGTRVFHATLKHGDKVHLGQTDLMYDVLWSPS